MSLLWEDEGGQIELAAALWLAWRYDAVDWLDIERKKLTPSGQGWLTRFWIN